MNNRKLFAILLVLAFVAGSMSTAHALPAYLAAFDSTYGTSGTVLDTCGVCHINPGGGGARNSYGSVFEAVSTHSSNPAGALATIASQASDCSGYTNLQLINLRINPGNGSCPAPLACTSFTYSAFGACQSNDTQTRTVTSSAPTGCTGGTPVLSQACTYVPPVNVCTSFTYSAFGACQSDNTQTRTVTSSAPTGCTGGTPVLSQACTYVPPVNACTSFTYSAFGVCQSNNTQTRTVTSSAPAGCTGGTPVLSQACTYVPPAGGTTVNVPAATGTGQITVETLTGGTNLTDVTALSATDASVNQSGMPSGFAFTEGLVSYKVTGVAIGGTVQVSITYPSAIPAGSMVYKVDSAGFHEYTNAAISGNTITLTLTDGGSGDMDGVANGVIDDPVGVASPVSTPPASSDSGGGGGCSIGARQNRVTAFADFAIILMPLFVMAALKRFRRRKQ